MGRRPLLTGFSHDRFWFGHSSVTINRCTVDHIWSLNQHLVRRRVNNGIMISPARWRYEAATRRDIAHGLPNRVTAPTLSVSTGAAVMGPAICCPQDNTSLKGFSSWSFIPCSSFSPWKQREMKMLTLHWKSQYSRPYQQTSITYAPIQPAVSHNKPSYSTNNKRFYANSNQP